MCWEPAQCAGHRCGWESSLTKGTGLMRLLPIGYLPAPSWVSDQRPQGQVWMRPAGFLRGAPHNRLALRTLLRVGELAGCSFCSLVLGCTIGSYRCALQCHSLNLAAWIGLFLRLFCLPAENEG